jgi:hypothetical protein
LNHRLHLALRFNSNVVYCNSSFTATRIAAKALQFHLPSFASFAGSNERNMT